MWLSKPLTPCSAIITMMNENTYSVLKFLYNNINKACSGEGIGLKLNMSRAGVLKHVKKLKSLNFNIVSGTKAGHTLIDDRDLLNEYYINLKLNCSGINLPVIYKEATGSTNLDAKEIAAKVKKGLVVANFQTSGRGRKERAFISKEGGLYFSYIIIPKNLKPYDALKTVLLCGIVVCRVCKRYGIDAKLKWPNDVIVKDKKICGILTEMISSSDILQHLILGIGININNDMTDVMPTAASLQKISGKTFKRAEILAETIMELDNIFSEFFKSGFSNLLTEYKSLSNTLGKKIKVIENEREYLAEAVDIDSEGFLIIRTESGESRLITADVSVLNIFN